MSDSPNELNDSLQRALRSAGVSTNDDELNASLKKALFNAHRAKADERGWPHLDTKEFASVVDSFAKPGFIEGALLDTTPGMIARSINRATLAVPYHEIPNKDYGLVGNTLQGLASMMLDPVTYYGAGLGERVAGAMLGKKGGETAAKELFKTAATRSAIENGVMFGTLGAAHSPNQQYIDTGTVDMGQTAKDAGKQAALGVAMGPASQAGLAAIPAEIGTLAVGQAAIDVRLPNIQDWQTATVMVLGAKGAKAIANVRDRLKTEPTDQSLVAEIQKELSPTDFVKVQDAVSEQIANEQGKSTIPQSGAATELTPPIEKPSPTAGMKVVEEAPVPTEKVILTTKSLLTPEGAKAFVSAQPEEAARIANIEGDVSRKDLSFTVGNETKTLGRALKGTEGDPHKFRNQFRDLVKGVVDAANAANAADETAKANVSKGVGQAQGNEQVPNTQVGQGQESQVLTGESNATQKGIVPQNNQQQYREGNVGGETAAPSSGDSTIGGGQEPQKGQGEAPLGYTGTKNAITDAERAAHGLEPIMSTSVSFTNEMARQEAMKAIDANPNLPHELIDELNQSNNRPPTKTEIAILAWQRLNLHDTASKALDRLAEAFRAEDDIAAQKAQDQYKVINAARNELDRLLKLKVGREAGLSLQARQMIFNEDYSLATQVSELQIAQGGKQVNQESLLKIKEQTEEIAKLQAQIGQLTAGREKAVRDTGLQSAIDQDTSAVEKQARTRLKPRIKNAKAAFDQAWEEFKTKTEGKLFSNPVEAVPELVKVAKAAINLGFSHVGQFFDDVEKRLGEWATRNRDAIEASWRQALDEIKPVVEGRKLESSASKSNLIKELALHLIRSGVKDREQIIDRITAKVQPVLPGIDREGVRNLYVNYGQYRPPDADEAKVRYRETRDENIQITKLRDMAQKKAPIRFGFGRGQRSDEARRLQQQVEVEKKKGGYVSRDPEREARTYLDRKERSLENRISDVNAEIETLKNGTWKGKETRTLPTNERIEKLTEVLDALREQRDALLPKVKESEVDRLNRYKRYLDRREQFWADKLARKDYGPVARAKPPQDNETRSAKARIEQIKAALDSQKQNAQWQAMNAREKTFTILREVAMGGTKAFTSGFDYSILGAQGFSEFMAHPLQTLGRAIEVLAHTRDIDYHKMMEDFRDRENFTNGNYELYKMDITDPGGMLSHQEDQFRGHLMRYLPKRLATVGNVAERWFSSYFNLARADIFDRHWAVSDQSPQAGRAIARFANIWTGRGELGQLAPAAGALNAILYSPRAVASRFQLLTLKPLRFLDTPIKVKTEFAKEYARTAAGVAVLQGTMVATLTALYGAGGPDKKWEFGGLDPRSSSFGQIRMDKTWFDLWGGLRSTMVFIARAATASKENRAGVVQSLRSGKAFQENYRDLVTNFGMGKLAPLPGAALDALSGTDMFNRPVSAASVAASVVTPMSWRDAYDALRAEGVSEAVATAIVSGLGIPTHVMADPDPKQIKQWFHELKVRPEQQPHETLEEFARRVRDVNSTRDFARSQLRFYGLLQPEKKAG